YVYTVNLPPLLFDRAWRSSSGHPFAEHHLEAVLEGYIHGRNQRHQRHTPTYLPECSLAAGSLRYLLPPGRRVDQVLFLVHHHFLAPNTAALRGFAGWKGSSQSRILPECLRGAVKRCLTYRTSSRARAPVRWIIRRAVLFYSWVCLVL